MAKTVFIINPSSASGNTGRRWVKIAPKASALFPEVEFLFTERGGHGEELTRAAIREGAERIVAVGGDGTMHEVLNGYFGSDAAPLNPEVSLAVLPMGTGSDLCRSLGIPRDPITALELLKRPAVGLDCGQVTVGEEHRFFGNIGSIGISGEIARYFEEHGKNGAFSYVSGLFKSARTYQKRAFSVTLINAEGEEKRYQLPDAFIAIFANGCYFGGGMKIAPHAVLSSGDLQCILVRGVTGLEIMRYLPSIFMGKHLKHEPFTSDFAIRAELETNFESWIELDGEPALKLGAHQKALIQVCRSKILCHVGQGAALRRR